MNNLIKKAFEVNFFFANVVIPAVALTLYCWSFAYISSQVMIEGVNYHFVSRLGKYILFITVAVVLVFLLLLNTEWGEKFSPKGTAEKHHIADLILLLLPLTPVVQYVLINQEILSTKEATYVLMFSLFFFGFYTFFLPILLSHLMPTRTILIVGLAFVFTLASMASISSYFSWFEIGSLRKQIMIFGGVFVLLWLFFKFSNRNTVYIFITLSFMINSVSSFLSAADEVETLVFSIENNQLLARIGERKPVIDSNIYLLVYDSYVPNETMLEYGIDNSVQEDYLVTQGFELYPHTYSIGSASLESMSKVLNTSSEYYGDARRGVSGDGVTHLILKDIGYETYGLFYSDYMFRGYGENYDYSFPENIIPPNIQLLKGIFLGEFRFDIENIGFKKEDRDKFIETKQGIFDSAFKKQIFVYMHTNRPAHSQNSGACLANENEIYKNRLQEANLEMQQDLSLIVKNDPNAIVIVAGDHGPYLTKNCYSTTDVYDTSEISRLDIQDRHGTFLAIRWPTGDFVKYDDITVLQDLFPVIFAYLYQDAQILEAKIEPIIPTPNTISNVSVDNGIIIGGIDDGQPLYLSDK